MKKKIKTFTLDMNIGDAYRYAGLIDGNMEDDAIMQEAWQRTPNGSNTSAVAETARKIKVLREVKDEE